MTPFLDELKWRGLFHQCTDEAGLSRWLADPSGHPRRAYVGFDPTADSLTIGNLVPIMMLRHFQLAGHQPVVVVGGGTGLIGDPSGKSAERQLMTAEQVAANVEGQKRVYGRLLDFGGEGGQAGRLTHRGLLLNNLDWLGKLGYLEVLRDIGKHFSVNAMIQKDSVRERLHARDQGISYTEFSYMVLQAYDFLHLWRSEGVLLQMGGSDQWGNIVAGCDLIRRELTHHNMDQIEAEGLATLSATDERREAGRAQAEALRVKRVPPYEGYGITAPLVTKTDGGKFGKSESGAVWLTADRTSPYAYYQFWLNAADADVPRYLRLFTLLPREQIDALSAAHEKDPAAREAHRTLAREATTLLHGPTEAAHAERAARALFTGEIAGLPEAVLEEALGSVPASGHARAGLDGGIPLVDLLPQTTLAKSKSEARELLGSGSITVNGAKAAPDHRLTAADLLHGRLIALRRGKKTWHLTRWS
ncbi:MAG: tyrosine--tRNA ligase [Phycisphaerales bacterium]